MFDVIDDKPEGFIMYKHEPVGLVFIHYHINHFHINHYHINHKTKLDNQNGKNFTSINNVSQSSSITADIKLN